MKENIILTQIKSMFLSYIISLSSVSFGEKLSVKKLLTFECQNRVAVREWVTIDLFYGDIL